MNHAIHQINKLFIGYLTGAEHDATKEQSPEAGEVGPIHRECLAECRGPASHKRNFMPCTARTMQSEALPQVSSNGEEGASQKDREAEAERACMEVL